MIEFCDSYHIRLGNSTTYYPQTKMMSESSNKSLVNIIKNMLQENKRNWHKRLTNALWEDRHSTKRSINMSPLDIVYGVDTIFPTYLVIPMMKNLQEIQSEPNDIQ